MNWRFSLTNTNNHVSTRELTQLPLAEIGTPASRNLYSSLIEEVKQVNTNGMSPKIEALVFALYGFSNKETKEILRMRSTPENETSAVLDELKALIN